jgi:NAD(P) transhydrogenase subunit alpha
LSIPKHAVENPESCANNEQCSNGYDHDTVAVHTVWRLLTDSESICSYQSIALLSWIAVNIELVYVLILSVIVGIEVISKVPSVLHTPLMSGANAIHGVVLIGAIIVLGHASPTNTLAMVLGFFAVVLGTLNVVGGFVVTDRMLEMFSKRKQNVS